MHAGGELVRIVECGYPQLPQGTVWDRYAYLKEHVDEYRRLLMEEPWGHKDMYGCVIVPPERADSCAGLIFMHNGGYAAMGGHAVIAVATYLAATGRVPQAPDVTGVEMRFDVPAGQVIARAEFDHDRVRNVQYESMPSFATALAVQLSAGGRTFTVDIAFGGQFYAIVPAASLKLRVQPGNLDLFRTWFREIRRAVNHLGLAQHPLDPRLSGLYGVVFTDAPIEGETRSRSITVFSENCVDRSPCGSCLSARLAAMWRKGERRIGDQLSVESAVGSVFTGTLLGAAEAVGPYPALRTAIAGEAHVVGFRRFIRDPEDRLTPFLLH